MTPNETSARTQSATQQTGSGADISAHLDTVAFPKLPDRVDGLNHVTLATSTAQGDVDFFVKVLGQRLLKRTLFYDGNKPIYHLYFGDEVGTPGCLMTTFPCKQAGLKGRLGAGQFTAIAYAAPRGSLDWWAEHLGRHGITASPIFERFGQRVMSFAHPVCGIPFELVEDDAPGIAPFASTYVPEPYRLRGFHTWTATINHLPDMDVFARHAWALNPVGTEGHRYRYEFNGGGIGNTVDFVVDSEMRPGTWHMGEGTVHHGAFTSPDLDVQAALKFDIEGVGFTDVSDRKHRGYFESVYVRTPGGVIFESTVPVGFTHDEPLEELGTNIMLPPQYESERSRLVTYMDQVDPIAV